MKRLLFSHVFNPHPSIGEEIYNYNKLMDTGIFWTTWGNIKIPISRVLFHATRVDILAVFNRKIFNDTTLENAYEHIKEI